MPRRVSSQCCLARCQTSERPTLTFIPSFCLFFQTRVKLTEDYGPPNETTSKDIERQRCQKFAFGNNVDQSKTDDPHFRILKFNEPEILVSTEMFDQNEPPHQFKSLELSFCCGSSQTPHFPHRSTFRSFSRENKLRWRDGSFQELDIAQMACPFPSCQLGQFSWTTVHIYFTFWYEIKVVPTPRSTEV